MPLQQLIADMAAANRTWGEERIAAELRAKLGLTVFLAEYRGGISRGARPIYPTRCTQDVTSCVSQHIAMNRFDNVATLLAPLQITEGLIRRAAADR